MAQDVLFYVYQDEKSLPSPTFHTLQITLNGSQYKNLMRLYGILNKEFQFGGSFGNNLDALFDSMTDLSWLPQKKFVLIISDTQDFLLDEDDDTMIDFLNTLNDIGSSINDEPLYSDMSRTIKFYFQASPRIEQLMDDAYLIWEAV